MQTHAFASALRLLGETPIILPSGLLLLNRRLAGTSLLMLPRMVPPADLGVQLAQAGLSRRPLILSPDKPCKMPRALRISPARNLLKVDLTPAKAMRRARLHQKWRNQLRRAEDGPLRVQHRPMKPDHPLLLLAAKQARTRRYENWPTGLTTAFIRAAPTQTHLFTALLRGHPVAHMLFFTHGGSATYHIGHSTPEGRSAHAHNLILWRAMQHFHRIGIQDLDLGPETTSPIDRFKCRAGGVAHPTGGTWLRWTLFARRAPKTCFAKLTA